MLIKFDWKQFVFGGKKPKSGGKTGVMLSIWVTNVTDNQGWAIVMFIEFVTIGTIVINPDSYRKKT